MSRPGLLAIAAILAICLPGIARAAAPKDYAFVLLQGRIADPYGKHPVSGATVRLTEGERVFEAVTDTKGVFVFDKLPVATFTLDIVAADGKLVRWFDKPDLSDPARARVKVKFGKSRGKSAITVVAHEDGEKVEIVVAGTPTRWGRFWKQFAIFAAGAGLLAL